MRVLKSSVQVLLALAPLAACDPTPNNATANADRATQVPPEPPTEADAATENAWPSEFFDTDDSSLTREEIIGMWSTVPHCAQPIVFAADGTYTNYTGNTGTWELNGSRFVRDGYANEVNQFDANTFSVGAPAAEVGPGAIRTFVIYRRC